jgi:negative regulator of flagellin synthesis FlgM
MDIRASLNGLGSLLGVTTNPSASVSQSQNPNNTTAASSGLESDQATFSAAGNEVSQAIADSDVRPEKVAAIQSALANGTYSVSASAVASKMVDAMLNGDR